MRTGVLTWAFGLICIALAAAPAQAQFDDEWRQHDNFDSSLVQPLDRILPEVRRNHPGRFYDAEGPFQGPDGQMHYRLKWMTPEGRVLWFDANARTGRVLGTGGGRHAFEGNGPADQSGPDERGMAEGQRQDRRSRFDDGEFGGSGGEWGGGGNDWDNDRGRGDDRAHGDWGNDHGGGDWGGDRGRRHGDWGHDRRHGDWRNDRGRGWGGGGHGGGPHFEGGHGRD
jgi:hypothetical protein